MDTLIAIVFIAAFATFIAYKKSPTFKTWVDSKFKK